MATQELKPSETAVVVIDMLKDFVTGALKFCPRFRIRLHGDKPILQPLSLILSFWPGYHQTKEMSNDMISGSSFESLANAKEPAKSQHEVDI